jgi:hypothetical protein
VLERVQRARHRKTSLEVIGDVKNFTGGVRCLRVRRLRVDEAAVAGRATSGTGEPDPQYN